LELVAGIVISPKSSPGVFASTPKKGAINRLINVILPIPNPA